jgi:hypothetical protein
MKTTRKGSAPVFQGKGRQFGVVVEAAAGSIEIQGAFRVHPELPLSDIGTSIDVPMNIHGDIHRQSFFGFIGMGRDTNAYDCHKDKTQYTEEKDLGFPQAVIVHSATSSCVLAE